MKNYARARWALCLIAASVLWIAEGAASPQTVWVERSKSGDVTIHLYVFWSIHCPHCLEANAFVDELAEEAPWLQVHSLELTQNPNNAQRYIDMATRLGMKPNAVPAFAFCERMTTGFDQAQTTGVTLRNALTECHEDPRGFLSKPPDQTQPEPILPIWLNLDPEKAALPITTVVIAALDAFNPCAFFVLLFLLSLMVHAGSRYRMLLVGGIFVFFSGAIYFVFMAAWLNAFLLAGELALVTKLAGAIASLLALVNVKDYFWYKRGPTLSIPERAKPSLYARVRRLVGAEQLSYLVAGTVVLAIAANSYELLCTAGFPMIYTRILTLHELSTWAYYGYLALYNLVYIIPLMTIVALFALRFSKRALSENEGRVMKLASGLMMLGLGLSLLVKPQILNVLTGAATVVLAALLATGMIVGIGRIRERRSSA